MNDRSWRRGESECYAANACGKGYAMTFCSNKPRRCQGDLSEVQVLLF